MEMESKDIDMICAKDSMNKLVQSFDEGLASLRDEHRKNEISIIVKKEKATLNAGVVQGEEFYQYDIQISDMSISDNKGNIETIDIDLREVKPEQPTAELDILSRDFTVNAMFYDIFDEHEEDYCGVIYCYEGKR